MRLHRQRNKGDVLALVPIINVCILFLNIYIYLLFTWAGQIMRCIPNAFLCQIDTSARVATHHALIPFPWQQTSHKVGRSKCRSLANIHNNKCLVWRLFVFVSSCPFLFFMACLDGGHSSSWFFPKLFCGLSKQVAANALICMTWQETSQSNTLS